MKITNQVQELYNSKMKSRKLQNMYVKNIKVLDDSGVWRTIQNKHIVSTSWGNGMNKIGKLDITVYVPDDGSYDFTQPGLWQGVLNRSGRRITFEITFPGASHTVDQFDGYIEKAEKEAKGGQRTLIHVYALNKGMYLKKEKTQPIPKDKEEESLVEILPEFLNYNYNNYIFEPYIPDPGQFKIANEKWRYYFTFPSNLIYKTYYENDRGYYGYKVYSKLTTCMIPNTPYLVINNGYRFASGNNDISYDDDYVMHKLTIYNMATGIEFPVNFVPKNYYHKEHYILCHPTKKMIGCFMPLYSRRTFFPDGKDSPRYTWGGLRIYDLTNRTIIYLERDDDIFKDNPSEPDDYKLATATWGVDGNIYYISKNKRIWKGEPNFKKKKIKWYRIGKLDDLLVDREGLLESAEIFNRQKDILEIIYLKENGPDAYTYEIAVYYQGNYDNSPDERIPITGFVGGGPFKCFYDGYYIMVLTNSTYVVVNQATGEANPVFIDRDRLPSDKITSNGGRIEYMNRTFFLFPAAKNETSDQYHVYYSNLKTNFTTEELEEMPSRIEISEERSKKEVLDEITENTDYSYYVDNVDGKLRIFFPNPKPEPDFVFEDGVNMLSLSVQRLEEISGVEVLYGSGENSQYFAVGEEPFTRVKLHPSTTLADAVEFAMRFMSRVASYEGTIETLLIPELNVNDTILIKSPFAFNPGLNLKGVVVDFDWKDANDQYGRGTIKFVAIAEEEG